MKQVLLTLSLLAIFIISLLFLTQDPKIHKSTKPTIVVSTFALYDIVKHLGTDEIELEMMIPFGVDLHTFEPTPKNMIDISKSALFIYSGAGLEPWIRSKNLAKVSLDISAHVKLRSLEEAHHHDEEHHHHHEESEFDPHYWLDIDNMILSATAIRDELLHLKLLNPELLEKNYTVYISALKALKSRYSDKLKSCKNPILVVNHNAFGYIAARYDFEIESISGLSSDAMPSAKTMAHINDVVQEHGVSTLFYERFVSDKMVKSISAQSGAHIDFLQALGNISSDEAQKAKSYINLMETNLNKMAYAMECE